MPRKPTGNPRGRPQTRAASPAVERQRENARRYYYGLPAISAPEKPKTDPVRAAAQHADSLRNARQQRVDWLAAYKLAKQCKDCERLFTKSYHLDFDHMPGHTKSFDLSKAGGRSWERIFNEVEKCQVVCALCHRDRSMARKAADYGKKKGKGQSKASEHPQLWGEGGW